MIAVPLTLGLADHREEDLACHSAFSRQRGHVTGRISVKLPCGKTCSSFPHETQNTVVASMLSSQGKSITALKFLEVGTTEHSFI